MWQQIQSVAYSAMRTVNHMGPQQWLIACGLLMLVGLLCLRGFGSRNNY